MGNSSTKEARSPAGRSRAGSLRPTSSPTSPTGSQPTPQTPAERLVSNVYSSRSGRGSRHDLSFLHLNRDSDRDTSATETKRETKQEREARKLEKERVAREKERERSIREEGVDGGYLVTLGTYTGPEDFNKAIARQLMIERRLAPFWKGLNDHKDSWVEHQLVAAVRGLPIPAADEIPPEMERTASQASTNPRSSDLNVNSLMVPINGRSQSYQSDYSTNLSASHPAFSSGPTSSSPSAPLFRGRAKTLASLASGSSSKTASPGAALTPQEMRMPNDPYVNGQPLEAYLYKDAIECPICFLYYPPYLNKTRCCDQPICSECFVQIKRPDPHPPEHHDDPDNPDAPKPEQEDGLLVSEPSACPFCVTPEFGVTYEPPPFRRGLIYPNQGQHTHPLASATSAMSSSSSLTSQSRRRTTSLSANAPQVITTDRVRPDWAKKLSDARAHALRRSAAATALHNAAYVLGNTQQGDTRGFGLGRRRRTLFGDSPSGSGSGTPRMHEGLSHVGALLAHADRHGSHGDSDIFPGRSSSRRTRVDDLEELMMMEAIRLSLAAEEDRKKKEEKELKKEAKKEEKKKAKEAKKADKQAKKSGSLYPVGTNDSASTWASMARSSSNLGQPPLSPTPPIPQQMQGKGKAPANSAMVGLNPLSEPTSTLNTEVAEGSTSGGAPRDDPQAHLEASRAVLQQPSQPRDVPTTSSEWDHRRHLRQLSTASSIASSVGDSAPSSFRNEGSFGPSPNASGVDISSGTPPAGGAGTEPMFNFRSLAAMIGEEGKERERENAEHVEHFETNAEQGEGSSNGSVNCLRPQDGVGGEGNRSRGDSGESSSSAPPPVYVEADGGANGQTDAGAEKDGDEITTAAKVERVSRSADMDKKHYGDVQILDRAHRNEATQ